MITASEAKTNALNAQEIIRLEKLQKEIERQARFARVVEDTINFCNTELSTLISDASLKGNNSLELHWGNIEFENFESIYSPLVEEETKYANGDSSFRTCGKRIHTPTMIKYLVSNGYKVEQFNWSYMRYGSGSQTGTRIYIQWNP